MAVKIDTHDDGGRAVADAYGISGIPHFVLMKADGAIVDRWVGYASPAEWMAIFDEAMADLTTVDAREARFASSPRAADAAVLGRVRLAEGKFRDAVRYLSALGSLDATLAARHAGDLVLATYRGMRAGEFQAHDVKAAAEALRLSAAASPEDLALVAQLMTGLFRDEGDPSLAAPYIARALAATDGTSDPDLADSRKDILVLDALHVRKDPAAAAALKKDAMEAGWAESASGLNEFAWWCFENEANLEEAEVMARKAVGLATPGDEKAMILDTLAEICNLRGDCGEALALIAQAIQEDPKSEHYPKQKARFEELLAKAKPARS